MLSSARSVDLDEWTPQQLLTMKLGGNGNARNFFRKHGITDMSLKVISNRSTNPAGSAGDPLK
jgi:hypothetical protein